MVKKIPRLLISNLSLRPPDYKVLKVFFCDNKLPCPIPVLTLIGKNNNNKKQLSKQTKIHLLEINSGSALGKSSNIFLQAAKVNA